MKEAILAFLLALVIGAVINSIPPATSTTPAAGTDLSVPLKTDAQAADVFAASTIPETRDATFETDVLQSEKPVFLDFYTEGCAPCKKLAPVIDKLAQQYAGSVNFYRIDMDQNAATAARYGVKQVPTMIIFKGGQRGESFEGLAPEDALSSAINKVLQP